MKENSTFVVEPNSDEVEGAVFPNIILGNIKGSTFRGQYTISKLFLELDLGGLRGRAWTAFWIRFFCERSELMHT